MAGNVYLSLSIEEITCKETKRGRQVLTQSSLQPSITSWFRPRRQGPYSTSERLHFLSGQRQGRRRRWSVAGGRLSQAGQRGNSAVSFDDGLDGISPPGFSPATVGGGKAERKTLHE